LAIFEAIPVDTGTNEPLKTDSFALEALLIEALPIKALLIGKALLIEALLVETNELAILMEIDERN
jgi:hypothetical protein